MAKNYPFERYGGQKNKFRKGMNFANRPKSPTRDKHDTSRLGADFDMKEIIYNFGGDALVTVECFLPDGKMFRRYKYTAPAGKKLGIGLPVDVGGRIEALEPILIITAGDKPIYRRVDYRWRDA